MESFNYPLKEGFEYATAGGEMGIAGFISVSPPTIKNIDNISPIRSEVMKALNWAANQQEGLREERPEDIEGDGMVSADALMTTVQMAPNIEVSKIILNVQVMLVKGLGQVEGEMKLTQSLWDKISIDDAYDLTGHFIVNFIMPSFQ